MNTTKLRELRPCPTCHSQTTPNDDDRCDDCYGTGIEGCPDCLEINGLRIGADDKIRLKPDGTPECDICEWSAAREKERLAKRRQEWAEICPARFQDVAYPRLELPAKVRAAVDRWLDPDASSGVSGSLILLGAVGTGKTTLAIAAAKRLHFAEDMPTAITSEAQMLASLRPDGDGRIEDYIGAAILLIDDLGTAKTTEWTDEILFSIVDGRWRERHALIVTSNLSPGELQETLGLHVWDRLRDDSVCIVLPGVSKRRSAVKAAPRLAVVPKEAEANR